MALMGGGEKACGGKLRDRGRGVLRLSVFIVCRAEDITATWVWRSVEPRGKDKGGKVKKEPGVK